MDPLDDSKNADTGFLFRHTLLTGVLILLPLLIFGWLLGQQQTLRRQIDTLELLAYFHDQVRAIEYGGTGQPPFQETDPVLAPEYRTLNQQHPRLLLIHQDGTIRSAFSSGDAASIPVAVSELFSVDEEPVTALLTSLPAWQRVSYKNISLIRSPLQDSPWQAVLILPPETSKMAAALSPESGAFALFLLGFACLGGMVLFNHWRMVRPARRLLQGINALDRCEPWPMESLSHGPWRRWFQRIESLSCRNRNLLTQEQKEFELVDRQLKERIMELERLSLAYQQELTERKRAEAALNRLNLELRELWPVDGLTGIASYRKFQEQLQLYWKQLLRQKRPLSILACSIDCHRQYSDDHGRQAADQRLREIAQAIQSALQRHNDLVARHGQAQFLALLPGTDAPGSRKVAAAVQQAIAALDIVRCGQPWESCIRVSIGLATTVPALGDSAENVLYVARSRCQTEPETVPD